MMVAFLKNELVYRDSRDLILEDGDDFEHSVQSIFQEITNLWWSCSDEFRGTGIAYTKIEQAVNEKKIDELSKRLVKQFKQMGSTGLQREKMQEFFRPVLVEFASSIFHIEEAHLEFIESSGMLNATSEFAKMARKFDPHISADDIYQAGRNVMTAVFIQKLLGLPAEVSPAIFGYSMLYPYTDNYLDDPKISFETKLAFNKRFERCLKGYAIEPANQHEENIRKLVGMIEQQWDREKYPNVYASLLAIHSAQVRSLGLVAPGASPYQRDVLGISFEKGGTSVLADGFLVAGTLSRAQARYLFGYGAFTQLMDDLEDLEQDQREGRLTIFTQAVPQWTLDGVTNQFFRFGHLLLDDLGAFKPEDIQKFKELIKIFLDPILIDIVGRQANHYSQSYLRRIEESFPFRFSSLKNQREHWKRQRLDMGRLIESML
jgi:hypothetical protein